MSQLQRSIYSVYDTNAIVIQKHWRGFSAYLKYQFDLADIVFIQSLARRRLLMKHFNEMKNTHNCLQLKIQLGLEDDSELLLPEENESHLVENNLE